MNSIVATIVTFAIALAFLRLMDFLAQRGWAGNASEPQTDSYRHRSDLRIVLVDVSG